MANSRIDPAESISQRRRGEERKGKGRKGSKYHPGFTEKMRNYGGEKSTY